MTPDVEKILVEAFVGNPGGSSRVMVYRNASCAVGRIFVMPEIHTIIGHPATIADIERMVEQGDDLLGAIGKAGWYDTQEADAGEQRPGGVRGHSVPDAGESEGGRDTLPDYRGRAF
jgi:hypothetical protein